MDINQNPEWQKAQRGELYRAFVPELIAVRDRCADACNTFNDNRDQSRRNIVRLWRNITNDSRPLPPKATTDAEDDQLFVGEPWIASPVHADYGFNIHLGAGSFINFNTTFVDTCPITIGARTLVGPNCSFYSGSHPLDPELRQGLQGPESGKPINIGEDCWLGGNVIVLQGITIGRGCTVGAGSVVTKDVPPFHVVVGNPARILRKIETAMDGSQSTTSIPANEVVKQGPEALLASNDYNEVVASNK